MSPAKAPARTPKPLADGHKPISLALQGGGAHGAFTWGVLDRVLEDGRLEIAGLSGTSAGAMNAVVTADGLARGGPDEARKRLAAFWRAASLDGGLPAPQRAVLDRLLPFWPGTSPMQAYLRGMTRFLSPYDLNPLNINPLKDLIERHVDFESLRRFEDIQLYVSATNVHTGEPRVFTRDEISAEAVMASAALPLLFHAVEIDDVPYWDGGYGANPAILPLIQNARGTDVLVVQISPPERHDTPNSTQAIIDRVNEITFSASLSAELKMLRLLDQLIEQGRLTPADGFQPAKLHRIALEGPALTPASRLDTGYAFLEGLRDAGRAAAGQFLDAHFDDIGVRGTLEAQPAAA